MCGCDAADRVYKKAIAILSTIRDSTQAQKGQPTTSVSSGILSKIFSSILPSPHGQGPFSSAIRIAMKLRHQSWLPGIVQAILNDREEDAKTSEGYKNTATVISLLKYAASLGHTDAMFTLASLSLVRCLSFPTPAWDDNGFSVVSPHLLLPLRPEVGIRDPQCPCFRHRERDDSITPRFLLCDWVPRCHEGRPGQSTAVLHVCCCRWTSWRANGAGIQVLDWDRCQGRLHEGSRVVRKSSSTRFVIEFSASNFRSDSHPRLAVNTFKAGPPGGKTIPPTVIKLSDLVGGVYGPGASVASTGLNSQRSVVKAASSHAAGDTWEDVLEYYLVRAGVNTKVILVTSFPSSTPTEEKRTLRTDLARFTTRALYISQVEVSLQEVKAWA